MHSLAQYMLLGSLIAGAAGALILAVITLRHGILRRSEADDASPEEEARRSRTVRLADTMAVLCFAVAAGLGVFGLTQGVRSTTVTADDAAMRQRVGVLEARLASAEQQFQQRPDMPDTRGWEERLARLESRFGAVEDRAAVAERRANDADRRAAEAELRAGEAVARRESSARPAPAATPKKGAGPVTASPVNAPGTLLPSAAVPPNASPRLVPPGPDVPRAPESSRPTTTEPLRHEAAISPTVSDAPSAAVREAPAAATVPPADTARAPGDISAREPARVRQEAIAREPVRTRAEVAPREPARPRAEVAPRELSFGERLRRDWSAIRDHAERGGDEWRDGWRQLKRLLE